MLSSRIRHLCEIIESYLLDLLSLTQVSHIYCTKKQLKRLKNQILLGKSNIIIIFAPSSWVCNGRTINSNGFDRPRADFIVNKRRYNVVIFAFGILAKFRSKKIMHRLKCLRWWIVSPPPRPCWAGGWYMHIARAWAFLSLLILWTGNARSLKSG